MITPQGMLELADETTNKVKSGELEIIYARINDDLIYCTLREPKEPRQAAAPQGRERKHIYVPESQEDNRCAICAHLPSASQHVQPTPAVAPDAGAAEYRERCDWPVGEFSFMDEPGEHDPCYVVMPGGAMLELNHHAGEGVDIARAHFIIDACNAALARQAQEPPNEQL